MEESPAHDWKLEEAELRDGHVQVTKKCNLTNCSRPLGHQQKHLIVLTAIATGACHDKHCRVIHYSGPHRRIVGDTLVVWIDPPFNPIEHREEYAAWEARLSLILASSE